MAEFKQLPEYYDAHFLDGERRLSRAGASERARLLPILEKLWDDFFVDLLRMVRACRSSIAAIERLELAEPFQKGPHHERCKRRSDADAERVKMVKIFHRFSIGPLPATHELNLPTTGEFYHCS